MDQVTELTSTVENFETRVNEAERKNENLEAQSRRDNLNFYGIEDDRKETWEQTELKHEIIWASSRQNLSSGFPTK